MEKKQSFDPANPVEDNQQGALIQNGQQPENEEMSGIDENPEIAKPEAEPEAEPEAAKPEAAKPEEDPAAEPQEAEPAEAEPAEAEPAEAEPAEADPAEADPAEADPEVEPEAEPEVEAEDVSAAKPAAVREFETQDEEDYESMALRYNSMGREELVVAIEELVKSDDVIHIRRHIGFIKASFRKQLREEHLDQYEKDMGSDQEENQDQDQEIPKDALTQRFDQAFNIYKSKKSVFDQNQEKEKQENLKIKEAILEELRNLIDSEEELKKTYDLFNSLQDRWRIAGPVPQSSKGTLWNNYHFLVEKFFDKVKINKELKDLDLKKNLEAKTALCEKAEELLLEKSITKSFQQLQKLHEAWKETGPVPKEKKDELWERFKSVSDKLNHRRQEHYDLLREDQNKNYAAKLALCEKAEESVATVPDSPKLWQKKTEEINGLFKLWKTIGFAPKKVNNEVWNRFRGSLDVFFGNKKEFFKKYKDVQRDNYNQKLNLCLQAEALKDSDDWKETTESLIGLQKEWKKIGPVPPKFSDKIWKRFRKSCDEFFGRKAEYFSNIGAKQEENLKLKTDLIEAVQSFSYGEDQMENLNKLKEFQRHWMEIGHVPIKHKDKLQQAFREAIDQQFEVLNISKKEKNTLAFKSRLENMKKAPRAGNVIQKERTMLVNKINYLESDIKVLENNVGFFASSKKADLLKAEFESKIENAKQEIDILKEKLKILREA